MTELNEGKLNPVEDKPEEKSEVKKIQVRFSIFFDGTLNNRSNVLAGVNSTAYRAAKSRYEWQNKIWGVGSYENDLSNVAKMELYVKKNESENIYSIYIEGQGTQDYKADSFRGKAMGLGQTGVTQRAFKGLSKVVWKTIALGSDTVIEKLTLDVFGFSRGAATARNFLYQAMNTKSHGRNLAWPLKKRLERFGIKVEKVEVQFAGIFDTVPSVGLPSQHKYNTSMLHLTAINLAKDVVHLAASEEHRENFSLTNTASAGNKEVFLPGVHSDIGGGYPDNYHESDLIIFKGTKAEVEAEQTRLYETGWFKQNQMTLTGPSKQTRGPARTRGWKLKVNRVVRNEYDRIPLHIMTEFARKSGIDLTNDLEVDYAVEDDFLLPLLDKLKSYANARSSKVEDWQGNPAWLLKLRNEYLHFSAHYNDTGMQPRFINGIRKRLVYEG